MYVINVNIFQSNFFLNIQIKSTVYDICMLNELDVY